MLDVAHILGDLIDPPANVAQVFDDQVVNALGHHSYSPDKLLPRGPTWTDDPAQ